MQSASIKVPLGWAKTFDIMNARDNEVFKASYLYTQKEVKVTFTILRIKT